MNHPPLTRTLRQIGPTLDSTFRWLEDQGLNIAPSRMASYKRDIEILENPERSQKPTSAIQSAEEAFQLTIVYEGLSHYAGQGLRNRLRRYLKGTAFFSGQYPDRRTDDSGNIGFELLFAARASLAGYEVDLDTDSDVLLRDGDLSLFVECKRPVTPLKLERHTKEGYKQLTKRYDSHTGTIPARGILAISISRPLRTPNEILAAGSENEIHEYASGLASEFLQSHQKLWDGNLDTRTICTAVYFNLACNIPTYKGTIFMQHIGALPTFASERLGVVVGRTDQLTVRHFIKRLSNLGDLGDPNHVQVHD